MTYGTDSAENDLSLGAMPSLDWSSDGVLASLHALYQRSENQAVTAIDWYLKEKRSTSRSSRALRAAAIVLIVVGGVIPLVSVAVPTVVGAPWGYVFLAVGAGCIAFDRFFGFSGSWIRYMQTQFGLQRLLAEFQFDWASCMAQIGQKPPGPAELDKMLRILRDFNIAVISLVEEETAAWATDLSEQLSRLESLADQNKASK